MIEYRHRLEGREALIYFYEPGDDLRPVFDMVARRDMVGFDTESSGLDIYAPGWFTRLAQFGDGREAHVLRYDCHKEAVIDLVGRSRALVMHNGDHDLHALHVAYGIPLEETCPKTIDTLMLSRLMDPSGYTENKGAGKVVPTHALKTRARMLLDGELDTDKELKARFRELKLKLDVAYAKIPIDDEVYVRYAGLDPILAYRLCEVLASLATPELWRLAEYERRLAFILATMHARGMKLDPDYTRQQTQHLRQEAATLSAQAEAMGWPVKDIAKKADKEALDAWLQSIGVKSPRTDKGALSFAKDKVVTAVAGTPAEEPFALFTTAREYEKFCRDYMEKFLRNAEYDGRLHPVIDAMGAQTARMSASNPPLQQLPRTGDIRGCTVADTGNVLVGCDLAQVEFCVGAALSGDQRMIKAIQMGVDLHDLGATNLYGKGFTGDQRNIAKRAGFGRLYGAGIATVARQCGVTPEVAEAALRNFDALFPGIRKYGRLLQDNPGHLVTPIGRHIAPDPIRPWGYINYMIQSYARDVFVAGVMRMVDAGLLDHMWIFVHDEAITNVPKEDADEVKHIMTTLMSDTIKNVPIRAEATILGERWVKT